MARFDCLHEMGDSVVIGGERGPRARSLGPGLTLPKACIRVGVRGSYGTRRTPPARENGNEARANRLGSRMRHLPLRRPLLDRMRGRKPWRRSEHSACRRDLSLPDRGPRLALPRGGCLGVIGSSGRDRLLRLGLRRWDDRHRCYGEPHLHDSGDLRSRPLRHG